jgi:AraC family transcriptional regulator
VPGSLPPSPPRRLIQRYDAEILSESGIEGSGFRVKSQTQDVTGHLYFDMQRPEHTLSLTRDGPPTRVEAHFDGGPLERFQVRSGQLVLLPVGQRIRGHTDGLGIRSKVQLFFKPELVTHAVGSDIEPSRVRLVRSMDVRNPNLLHAMAALGREVEKPGPMGRLYAESLVLVTLTELVRHHSTLVISANLSKALPSRRLRRLIDYIEAHLGEDLSLLTLAAEADMSPAHLARAFKRAMGGSVHRYLLRRRVEWAAALLVSTEQTIAEIALQTGFSSQAHLTTAFRHFYGTTPAAHRRDRR